VTVTACGAQNTDMINIFIIVLYLFFHSGFCVPPIHQELPRLDGFSSKLIFHRILLLLDAWGFNCRVSSIAIKCGITKGQIKPKADWCAIGSPKKTNEQICFVCFFAFYGKQNKFVRSFCQSAFSFI
jgi:hypothetical protein